MPNLLPRLIFRRHSAATCLFAGCLTPGRSLSALSMQAVVANRLATIEARRWGWQAPAGAYPIYMFPAETF